MALYSLSTMQWLLQLNCVLSPGLLAEAFGVLWFTCILLVASFGFWFRLPWFWREASSVGASGGRTCPQCGFPFAFALHGYGHEIEPAQVAACHMAAVSATMAATAECAAAVQKHSLFCTKNLCKSARRVLVL